MTISVQDFHNLPIVKESQEIQKRNPFGSKAHRDAYINILETAKEHNVIQHFETLEIYDDSAKDFPHFNK